VRYIAKLADGIYEFCAEGRWEFALVCREAQALSIYEFCAAGRREFALVCSEAQALKICRALQRAYCDGRGYDDDEKCPRDSDSDCPRCSEYI
jgi:hypothetical protein